MNISIIAAVARNRVIGKGGKLPWHLPADLKHFKALTMGKPVIMGRKTWESIGKPLPGRMNIVVTSAQGLPVPAARTLGDALKLAGSAGEVFVIGGARLFADALPRASRLYLTQIEADVEGDVLFPAYNRADWKEVSRVVREPDDKNAYRLIFSTFERILNDDRQ